MPPEAVTRTLSEWHESAALGSNLKACSREIQHQTVKYFDKVMATSAH
jgi:hypothetical protein